jgi:hypothetical protein
MFGEEKIDMIVDEITRRIDVLRKKEKELLERKEIVSERKALEDLRDWIVVNFY